MFDFVLYLGRYLRAKWSLTRQLAMKLARTLSLFFTQQSTNSLCQNKDQEVVSTQPKRLDINTSLWFKYNQRSALTLKSFRPAPFTSVLLL